jgi:hypothetical protein
MIPSALLEAYCETTNNRMNWTGLKLGWENMKRVPFRWLTGPYQLAACCAFHFSNIFFTITGKQSGTNCPEDLYRIKDT